MDKLKIYVDRLKNGNSEKLDVTLPPAFLEIQEKDLSFPAEIHLSGQAYLADDHLVVQLDIQTAASLPCSICNDSVLIPIDISDHYFSEPLCEVKSSTFDLANEVREAILLQTPQFAECHNGNCPERSNLKKYLHTPQKKEETAPPVVHFPFADLDKN